MYTVDMFKLGNAAVLESFQLFYLTIIEYDNASQNKYPFVTQEFAFIHQSVCGSCKNVKEFGVL